MTDTKAQTIRQIVPLGPSVVYAPPAFKGQRSGGTKARFAAVEARLKAAQTPTPHQEYVQREKAAREWRAIVLPKMEAAGSLSKLGKSEPDKVATDLYFANRHDRRNA